MNKLLIAKIIKTALNIDEELVGSLEGLCDTVIDENTTGDDKVKAFNSIVYYIQVGLEPLDVDLLVI